MALQCTTPPTTPRPASSVLLSLCGDVMTGRGIDQILPHRSVPHIFEPYVDDARVYLQLAERVNGPLPPETSWSYVWGDALDIWRRMNPDLRIVNLETSVTTSEDYWKGKGINYRMHPGNAPCLKAGGIDVCCLANNHVIDWGYAGLEETLAVLEAAGIDYCGAGRNAKQAAAPAVRKVAGGRVVVFAYGSESSGVPPEWQAGAARPGVNFLQDLSAASLRGIATRVREIKRTGDLVILSLHWGPNWGFEIEPEEKEFTRGLIDEAGVDVVYGHSSHHVKGIEVYRGRPIIYGCGDFLNDYEGIRGYRQYRGDLGLLYFLRCDLNSGKLLEMRLSPTAVRRFSIHKAAAADASWLRDTLNREGSRLGTSVSCTEEGDFTLSWNDNH